MARTKHVKRNRDWLYSDLESTEPLSARGQQSIGPKRALDGRPGGRSKGRPHFRWFDGVENDLRKMRVRGWRRSAENRTIWRDICKEARVLQGL